MDEIPEDIREKAEDVFEYWMKTADTVIADLIARALLDERQSATAAERERCAKIAENRHKAWRMPHPDDASPGEVCCDVSACSDIAAAIRG